MSRKGLLYSLLCLCLALWGAGFASAQTVQGVITGNVVDPSGANVPGAVVTITNEGTGVIQTTKSESSGAYRFSLVPPGTYKLSVTAPGFATIESSGIVVEASQTIPFPIKLQVAGASQVVEVTEQVPLVQTETSDLSLQIDHATIQNMALVDRDVFNTLPFLAPQAQPGLDTGVTAGGARESGTSFMLNGAEDNDNFGEGVANVHPPLESVQDFSIVTNSMSAQFGRGMGAVISANQKSGTNHFHGVAYEFNRNASLNANDYLYNIQYLNDPKTLSKRPKYIRNQFGGEVEGPIFKDRTFFAAAYDRTKLLSGATSAHNYVPTSAGVAYVLAHGGPLAQSVLKAAPPVTSDLGCGQAGTGAGTTNGLPNTVGCLSFFDPQTDTADAYYARVDQNFGTHDRLSAIANVYRELNQDKFGGGPLTTKGPIPASTINHFHNLALTETHTFGPALLNEFTVSHNRHYNVFQEGNGTADTIPNIVVDNQNEGYLGFQIGGDYEGGQVQNFTQDRWQIQDNVTFTKGAHSFKFGFGTQYGILYRNWDLGLPGQYEFGELYSVNNGSVVTAKSDGTMQSDGTIANVSDQTQSNFAGDYPYFEETSVNPQTGAKANAYRHYVYHDNDIFAQDDWKLTKRVTLNLGVRWDRYGAPGEVHGILAQFPQFNCSLLDVSCIANLRTVPVSRMWPTQNHDFAPRVGFAWDVMGDGRMAVRGGYGIFYDRIFDNIWSNGSWNPPFYALLDFDASGTDAIFYTNPASIGTAYNPNGPCGPIPYAPSATCSTRKRVSVRTMDQHMKDSSGQNFFLGVERQLPGNILLRANYQAELGRHLPMLQYINRYDGDAYNSSLSPVQPNGVYTGFNYRQNNVSSNYNALVLEAQKRMSNGLQVQASYTMSKLLDLNSELFAGCSTIGGQAAPYYFTTNTRPQLEYGRASFDHRGSIKIGTVYQLPFFKNDHGFAGELLGGWHIASFFQYYTGHPVEVWDGRSRRAAVDANGKKVLDPNGVPYNVGGDYNLDGVRNDRPDFVGSNVKNVYSHKDPYKGIFTDNNIIGCASSWVPANVSIARCNAATGATTPNKLFATPAYPSAPPYYARFGNLGRDVFVGPAFAQLDMSLGKGFRIGERLNLDVRVDAQNIANHPNWDAVTGNLASANFGQAQVLTPFGLGAPKSRVMSLGARLAF